MDVVTKPNLQTTIKATGVVLGLLPQLAGLIVGLTAVAYLVGWRETTAFYSVLGAPWATSLLTTSQVMTSSIWIVSGIGLFFVMSIYMLSQGAASSKSLRLWSIIFMCIAGALYIAFLLAPSNAGGLLAAGMSICWSWSTGLALGELVASLAANQVQWHAYHMYIIYFVVTFGLIYVSDTLGSTHAKTIVDTQGKHLALVVTGGLSSNTSWRLISPVNDKILLMQFANTNHKHMFVLASPENIRFIEATTN
jgi:hypothetical protein